MSDLALSSSPSSSPFLPSTPSSAGLDSDWASSAPSPIFSSLSRSGSVSGHSLFTPDVSVSTSTSTSAAASLAGSLAASAGGAAHKTPRKGRAAHQTHARGASSLSSPRKGNGSKLALEEKVAILRYIDMYPGVNQSVVAELFGVERSTVSKTKNDRAKYEVPWRESERGRAEAREREEKGETGLFDPFSPFLAVEPAGAGAASRSKKAHARRQSESVLTKPAGEVEDEFRPKLLTKRQLAKSATATVRAEQVASQTPVKPAVIPEMDESTPTNSTTSSRATTMRHASSEFGGAGLEEEEGVVANALGGFGMPGGLVQDTPSRHASLSSLSSWSSTEAESVDYQHDFTSIVQQAPALTTRHEVPEPIQSPLIANATTLLSRNNSHTYPDQALYNQQSPYQPPQPSQQYHHPRSGNTSPVDDSFHHRTGSTASSTSWQSGLTAFSSQGGGNTSSLAGSVYGSVPAAGAHSRGGSPLPAGVAYAPGHFFGQAPEEYHPAHGPSQAQAQYQSRVPSQPQSIGAHAPSGGRQATISGGPAFSESVGQQQRRVSPTAAKDTPSLAQAVASLEVAFQFLTSSAAQGLITPKDLVMLSDLQAKMAARAGAQAQAQVESQGPGQSHAAASQARAGPASLGHRKSQSVALGGQRAPLSRASSSSSIASFVSLASYNDPRRAGSGASLLANFDGSAQLSFE